MNLRRTAATVGFFASLVLVWQGLVLTGWWSPVLLPPPLDVGSWLWTHTFGGSEITRYELLQAAWVTLRRLLLGFVCGIAAGIPLGLLTAASGLARRTLGVLALGLQTLPSVCWVPLALIWFGQSEAAMFFVVVMGTVWSVIIATETGVRNLPPIYVRAARTMGSRGLHTLVRVTLPASLPYVIGGMKQGWAFAWRSLMAAEIYVTVMTGFGLGSLLHYGRELNAMDQVVAVMLCIVAFGLAADKLLFGPWESWLRRRWGTGHD